MNPRLNFVRLTAFALSLAPAAASAQVPFAVAVNQAIQNSPHVRSARDDVAKARAGVAVMRDIFVPSVVLGGGLGTASGITLSVPTIFTVSAQSLIYSPQQRSYIRSAHLDLKAATFALDEARNQVAEDAADTYLVIGHDQGAIQALLQQFDYQLKLVSIIQDRVDAHLDNEMDLKKARRDALQMRLQMMQTEDDLNTQRSRLAEMTNLPAATLIAQPQTVPDLPQIPEDSDGSLPKSPGMLAAEINQESREIHAHADAQYSWRPIVSFGAQYGRVSPIENVSEFYNLHGNYNSASIGVQFQFPLFDRVRSEAAKVSAADAAHGALDLQTQQFEYAAGMQKLQRSAAELNIKAQLADLDYGIAQDQLQSVIIASQAATTSAPITPKEVERARIQERQDYVGMLDARLDAARAEINYLRQTGQLQQWVQSFRSAGISR